MKKLHANVTLEEGYGAAHGGRRASEFAARPRKAAFVERGEREMLTLMFIVDSRSRVRLGASPRLRKVTIPHRSTPVVSPAGSSGF